MMGLVMESPSLRFAAAVRALTLEARRADLVMPSFRSPPRLAGVDRSRRRRVGGGATIAVVVRSRPWPAVLADMIDGVIVTNRLRGAEADQIRARLWRAVGGEAGSAAA
jgi:hypothetical protein